MKTTLKITIIILTFFSLKSNAQIDTLNYLKQFEVNKVNYIGQPLSKLLNDMTQIQPKSIWTVPIHSSKNYARKTQIKFCNMDKSFSRQVALSIEWETPIPTNETIYYENLNHFYFTNDERNFYGNKIIKDIKVYR